MLDIRAEHHKVSHPQADKDGKKVWCGSHRSLRLMLSLNLTDAQAEEQGSCCYLHFNHRLDHPSLRFDPRGKLTLGVVKTRAMSDSSRGIVRQPGSSMRRVFIRKVWISWS